MNRILILTLTSLSFFALACGEDAASQTTEVKKEAPALPADVQSVAPAGQTQTTSATSTSTAVAEASPADSGLVTATGEFISPAQSELAPKFPGRVAAVFVDEGARVGRGQPLAALETDYMRLELARAEAELQRATSAANDAARDLARKRELRAKESVPQAMLDRSVTAAEQSQAARSGAASAVQLMRRRLSDATIRSPINGVVSERRADVGEHLGEANVAFVVLQTSPLKLRFSVPERYLARLRSGQTVVASVDPYPGEEFRGTVKTVGGVIDPKSRTLFAEAEFANTDGRLRPGLFARVQLNLQ